MERFNGSHGSLECYNFGAEFDIKVFHPTMEEFKDFEKYLHHMEEQGAHKAGIAKVVPPAEWVPRKGGYSGINEVKVKSPIEQNVVGSKGAYQLCNVEKNEMTVQKYLTLANSKRYEPPTGASSYDELERSYWKNMHCFHPIYGADVPGSLTDESQECWNIATLPSILKYINDDYGIKIQGVNTPYLYFGMWRTTFPWHTEDADLYSINYLHFGAPKFWYAVSPSAGLRLERVAQGYFQSLYKQCHAFLRHKTTVLSPSLLHNYSIPYNKVLQFPGEFMITFPYAYHAGFNTGFNCAESTNFALPRWVDYGKYCSICECMPDSVKIDMDCFVRRYQPDRYDAWITGSEKAVHPEGAAAGQVHLRLPAKPPPLTDDGNPTISNEQPMYCRRQGRPRGRPPKMHTSSTNETTSKKMKIADTCKVDANIDDKSNRSRSESPDEDSHKKPNDSHFPSKPPGQLPITDRHNGEQHESSNCKNEPQESECIKSETTCYEMLSSNENADIIKIVHKENILQENSSLLCSCTYCSNGDGKVDDSMIDVWNTYEPVYKALRPLWIWNSFSFDAERSFNHYCSMRAPHCSICQAFVSETPETHGPCPPLSVPVFTELTFALRTKHRQRHITSLQTSSHILHCQRCLLTVHSFCYGAEECENENWHCDRCAAQSVDAHCSLCVLRGGALKRTKSGRWAHIICAMFAEGAAFEADSTRSPIIEPNDLENRAINQIKLMKNRKDMTKCRLCQRTDGAFVRCKVGNCHSMDHVTCGVFHGALFVMDDWPTTTLTVCLLKHIPQRESILTGCNAPCPDVGDPVLYVIGENRRMKSKACVAAGVVTRRSDIYRYHVRFCDNLTSCENIEPSEIIEPPIQEVVPGCRLLVRWTNGMPFEAVCRDVHKRFLFDLELENGTHVKDVTLGQIAPFYLKNYDPNFKIC